MFEPNDGFSLHMSSLAEREMAAFLGAMGDVAVQISMRRAGDAWLHVMESLGCPDENLQKFFRRVTILAISQLLAESGAAVREEKSRLELVIKRQFDSRTAA